MMKCTPANLLFPAPVDELVFSNGRWRRFERCKRAFFYYYVACRGGGDPGQPAPIRELYRLKQLTPLTVWLDELLWNAVDQACLERPHHTQWFRRVERHAFRQLQRGLRDSELERWRDDPAGALHLLEVQYRLIDPFRLPDLASAELKNRLQHWKNTWHDRLSHLPAGSYQRYERPWHCHYQELQLYFGASFFWREGFGLQWVAWHWPAASDDVWIRYYACKVLGMAPDRVAVCFYHGESGHCEAADVASFDFFHTAEATVERAVTMRDWLRVAVQNGLEPEELPRAAAEHCRLCRFRLYCDRLEAAS